MNTVQKSPIKKVLAPFNRFIQQEKSGAIVLGICVVLALILANSPWSEKYFEVLHIHLGIAVQGATYFDFSVLHWINDGLMSVFFFVVGLELKRELMIGELAEPKKALLPIIAALGGMLVPAGIYLLLNAGNPEVHAGWGIPMATDIAFALGVLYFLGDKVPLPLKVFLTALAIVDDLGAVLVIAIFYTSDLSMWSLLGGFGFLLLMLIGNKLGIKNIFFYALLGIAGVWTSFLASGVHATIAAVLAAFTIPSKMEMSEHIILKKIKQALQKFGQEDPTRNKPSLTNDQVHQLYEIKTVVKEAIPPLQRLEHALHPFVSFLIVPIFALANAGVSFMDIDLQQLLDTNIVWGVALGLLFGKVVGVFGFTWLAAKLKIATLPDNLSMKNLLGLSFLAAIGFTMSLFVTTLAFDQEMYQTQAKVGIFTASLLGGLIGYFILNRNAKASVNNNTK